MYYFGVYIVKLMNIDLIYLRTTRLPCDTRSSTLCLFCIKIIKIQNNLNLKDHVKKIHYFSISVLLFQVYTTY